MAKELTRLVGLTGGMGAGKSTIVESIKEAGIPVCDVDVLVREIYGEELFCMELDDEWGLVKGEDVKAQMAQMITQYPDRLPRLEEIIGPWIESFIESFVKSHLSTSLFVVMDAPLLFEAHWDDICDFVIAVQCPIEIRKERVMKRPGMTLEKMELLMSRQISEAARLVGSHYIIHNTGTILEARTKAQSIIDHLKGFYSND